MSSVNFIATTQSSVSVTAGKLTAQQTSSQPQSSANASSSVTFSSSGTAYANYEQIITEKTAGQNQVVAYSLANPTSPLVTQNSYDMAHGNLLGERLNGVFSLHSLTRMDAPISYTNGEPVTVASQTYYTQQATIYQNQALQLYNTEKAKGTTPGQIVSDLYDLQAKQPDAFRAMNAWPPASGPTSIQDATNTSGVAPQYLNASEEIINSSSSSSNYDQLIAQEVTVKNRVLSNVFDSLISSSAAQPAPKQSHPAANTSSATISQAARDALAASVANATEQSSSVMAEKPTASKTVSSAQHQSSSETRDSAIPANSEASFKQAMAEKFAGGNAINAMIKNDPSNPMWTGQVESWAQHDFTLGHDVGYDFSGTKPGDPGRFLGGEPVTAESKAYMTQQTVSYQSQLREMISSEKSKGTASADILLKIFDQQGQQPARFRAMMAWPIASDFTNNQPSATSGGVKSA